LVAALLLFSHDILEYKPRPSRVHSLSPADIRPSAHLFYAFKEIHERHYSLRNEKATIQSLEQVISNMRDEYRKKQCSEYLSTIKENSGFLSSTLP
jgi:hypothetical protein